MVEPMHDPSGSPSPSEATEQQVASDADVRPDGSPTETASVTTPADEEKQGEATAGSLGPSSPDHSSTDSSPDGDDEDHEGRLADDLEELTAKAHKAEQYLELAQRTKADFENYRKRAARDAATAQERGAVRLARELLPAIDNLDRTLEAAQAAEETVADDGAHALVSGIKLVHTDLIAALTRAGIERFSPEGETFDPQQHEAVAQQPVEGAEPGTVVEVYQRGYRLGDAVIRPARVVVAG
jgi:molecular chaperone GrpE